MKIHLFALALVCASTFAHADTPEDRCTNLAEYSEGVAELRDEGVRLKDVLEVVEERAARRMVDVYSYAAKIVYQHGNMTPAEINDNMLSGCLETVDSEKAKRAKALKTSF